MFNLRTLSLLLCALTLAPLALAGEYGDYDYYSNEDSSDDERPYYAPRTESGKQQAMAATEELFARSKSGDLDADTLQQLVDSGANVNARDSLHWNPLHYAAQEGHDTAAQSLINAGADIWAKTNPDRRGRHPRGLATSPSTNAILGKAEDNLRTKKAHKSDARDRQVRERRQWYVDEGKKPMGQTPEQRARQQRLDDAAAARANIYGGDDYGGDDY